MMSDRPVKKRAVNLFVDTELLDHARRMRINISETLERRLRSLGLRGRMLKVAQSSRGAWHLAGTGSLQSALSNATLRRYGFLMPSDLADY